MNAVLQVAPPAGSPPLTQVASGTGSGFGNGPLVSAVSWSFIQGVLDQDPAQLSQYVNGVMLRAEQNAPEGAWMQLDLQGWRNPVTGTSYAADVADEIQAAFGRGQIVDPETGETPGTWTTQEAVLATGDPGSDTVTLRWVKGQPFLLWILAGILVAVAIIIVWNYLRNSLWGGYVGLPGAGGTGSSSGTGALSSIQQYVVVLATVTVLGLGGYAWWRIEVAKAGASRSQQTIEVFAP